MPRIEPRAPHARYRALRTVSLPHRRGRHKRLPTQKGINNMLHMLKTYIDTNWYREEGATAVEYGIMVALIAVVIITAVGLVGTNLENLFNTVADEVNPDT